MISSSLDWQKEEERLVGVAKKVEKAYYGQALSLIDNMWAMNTYLSKLEVDARRTKNHAAKNKVLDEINRSILDFEQYVFLNLMFN